MHGKNLNLVLTDPIDQAIVAKDDLTDLLNVQFWHNPTGPWIIGQPISSPEGSLSEHSCDLRCVPGDEKADGLKVIESLWSPPYFSHLAMR